MTPLRAIVPKITSNTNLVDVVFVDDGVKRRVQVVEHGDDLERGRLGRESREADDVGEEDGDAVERLRGDRLAGGELTSHDGRQHLVQQRLHVLRNRSAVDYMHANDWLICHRHDLCSLFVRYSNLVVIVSLL